MPKSIWINGELVLPEQATISVYDHGLLYGDGVFEGIRIYNSRIFKLDTHLRRLEESAKAIRLNSGYTIDELTAACKETMADNGLTDGYIRLVITRGVGNLGLGPFDCHDPVTFIIADTIQLYPKELYEKGIRVVTSSVPQKHPAGLSPRIKSLNYLNNILAKMEAHDAGVPEAVMLNHQGFVSECTADNIFIVRPDRITGAPTLTLPPLHAGMLEGVTMNEVMKLAHQAGIAIERADLTRHDLYTAQEMFVTGSGAEIVPVVECDGRPINDGTPGQMTQQLIKLFRELVKENAPED